MYLQGVDYIQSEAANTYFSAKMTFNARGAIFFPVRQEHRDMKADGISYEDDYRGNALAAMLGPGKIEVRWHRDYPDRKVAQIVRQILAHPELAFMADWRVTYQGRAI